MKKKLLISLIAAPLMMVASVASAFTYGFTQITPATVTAAASQFKVDVTNSGGNALFKFTNNVGIASSITEIYFDYGNTNYFSSISNNVLGASGESDGVIFNDGGQPSNLPGGNQSGVNFSSDAMGQSFRRTANGVNASTEWVAFLGNFRSGVTFDNLIAGLDSGLFRIGLHVRAIGDVGGDSRSFVNTTPPPNPVPLPAAAWLFGSALLGFASLSNRRKNLS